MSANGGSTPERIFLFDDWLAPPGESLHRNMRYACSEENLRPWVTILDEFLGYEKNFWDFERFKIVASASKYSARVVRAGAGDVPILIGDEDSEERARRIIADAKQKVVWAGGIDIYEASTTREDFPEGLRHVRHGRIWCGDTNRDPGRARLYELIFGRATTEWGSENKVRAVLQGYDFQDMKVAQEENEARDELYERGFGDGQRSSRGSFS